MILPFKSNSANEFVPSVFQSTTHPNLKRMLSSCLCRCLLIWECTTRCRRAVRFCVCRMTFCCMHVRVCPVLRMGAAQSPILRAVRTQMGVCVCPCAVLVVCLMSNLLVSHQLWSMRQRGWIVGFVFDINQVSCLTFDNMGCFGNWCRTFITHLHLCGAPYLCANSQLSYPLNEIQTFVNLV